MGLLSYIDTMEQKGPGLLARASQYDDTSVEAEDFYTWCKTVHFSHAAIFQRDGNAFYITKAVGIDAETIALSYSSTDFWDGTLTTNSDWQSYLHGTLESATFNQFFSEELLSIIEKLHFIKLDDSILMVIQDEETLSLPNANAVKRSLIQILYAQDIAEAPFETESAIQKGLMLSNANLYLLSVKVAVQTAIKEVPFADESGREKITQTIYHEIFRICTRLFQRPNCCKLGENGEVKIAFFAKDEVDEQLMQFHIANALTEIVGSEAAKAVILLAAGICPNVKGTVAFLQQG